MIELALIVLFFLGFYWLRDYIKEKQWTCRIIGHKWNKHYGYYEERVANGATCERCGVQYNG